MANSRVIDRRYRKLAIGMIVLPIVAVLVYAVHNVRTPESHAQDLASYGFTGGGNVPGTCCGIPFPDAGDAGGDGGTPEFLIFGPSPAGLSFGPPSTIAFGPDSGPIILQYNPADGGLFWGPAPSTVQTRAYYGSGVDGVAHATAGCGVVLGATCVGGVYTLTRTVAFTDFTIDVGVVVKTAGSWIFAQGTVLDNGTISNDGSAGGSPSGGAGAPHLFIGGGSDGGAGDSTGVGGSDGTTFVSNIGLGGTGGPGGSSTSAGGSGGGLNNSHSISPQSIPHSDYLAGGTIGVSGPTGAPSPTGFGGGSGGGGGGQSIGAGGSNGGGGGGGGGEIGISTAVLSGSGAIHSRGGAGGNGVSGGGGTGAGGGGGGGGFDVIIKGDDSGFSGTIDESGGTGGAGTPFGTGGSPGQSIIIQG